MDIGNSNTNTKSKHLDDEDPWNLSNDEYYRPLPGAQKRLAALEQEQNYGCPTIRHTRPALDLCRAYFPTFMTEDKLRHFHRPKLRRYSRGRLANNHPQGVRCLTRHIIRRHCQLRARVISAINAGWPREEIVNKHLLIHSARGLTAKCGELILFEYMEQHPALLSQIGMASNIRNYFWPKSSEQKYTSAELRNTYEHGIPEIVLSNDKPFLGTMKPARSLQALTNNMFRAPIYRHNVPECDFLVIRTRDSYYIRTVDTIFTVGQQLPLMEVPCESRLGKTPKKFWQDRKLVHIYRLFLNSDDNPKRLKHSEIVKAFPYDSDYNIKRRMRKIAYLEPTEFNDYYWILKDKDHKNSRIYLPSEQDIRKILRPEQCCAYYSMMAAGQRLIDSGYLNARPTPKHENDEVEDEIKSAPWNTTKAFTAFQDGKCYLDLRSHIADPTGRSCREGFSYVRMPKYATQTTLSGHSNESTLQESTQPKTASTPILKKAKVSNNSPFPLNKKSSHIQLQRKDMLERLAIFRKESQRLFELQNTVLSSAEILSSDEGTDSSEDEKDESLEQSEKDLEKILIEDKSTTEFYHDKEEEERIALMKELFGSKSSNGSNGPNGVITNGHQNGKLPSPRPKDVQAANSTTNNLQKKILNIDEGDKLLRIHRTYENDGEIYVRVETVRRPAVIDLYIQQKERGGKHPISVSQQVTQGQKAPSISSFMYSSQVSKITQRRRSSLTLEEGEVIKIEDTRLILSKKVLQSNRRLRNVSRKNYNYGT